MENIHKTSYNIHLQTYVSFHFNARVRESKGPCVYLYFHLETIQVAITGHILSMTVTSVHIIKWPELLIRTESDVTMWS